MARIVIILAVIAVAMLMWFKIKNAKGEERKKLIIWGCAGIAIAVLGILAVTGRLNIITAAIGGLIALLPKLVSMLRYLPLINRFRQQANQQQSHHQQASSSKQDMTKAKACEVLGIKSTANREEIIAAHRRMMQKVHPDRGGSDYLAAEINRAKDTLLG
jgi:DnaJ family protein C protein 19